jgi:hypothetical protein
VPGANIFQQKLGGQPLFFWRYTLAVRVTKVAQTISYSFAGVTTCGRIPAAK